MNYPYRFGLDTAQVGGEKVGSGLRRLFLIGVRAGPDRNQSLGRLRLKDFKCFCFFRNRNKHV
jgi:hypothetical protein